MSDDEKKYNIDDILAEYDNTEEITGGLETDEDYPEDILEPVEDDEDDSGDIPAEVEWADNAEDIIAAEIERNAAEIEKAAAEIEETVTETEENAAETEETVKKAAANVGETAENADVQTVQTGNEENDVNEKWITRFLKGIFPVKGDGVFEVIRKIIFLAAVIVFIGAGAMLASTLIQSRRAISDQNEARGIIETTVGTYIDEDGNIVIIPPTDEERDEHNKHVAEFFKELNNDYIGYLEIDGCEIYEPVVKANADDDNFYLKHNLRGEDNKAGTIFLDSRCTVTEEYTSPNLVIYGHNQEDGTMFGRLKYYKNNIDFYSKHPVIRFNPEFENGEYLIYAFFVTNALANQDSNGEVFHYHDYIETMNDEYTFNWYQREVQSRNQIISPVDVKFGDKLLCLSTCSNEFTESRFVVFARKLRDGESASDYDFSETRENPSARGVDWKAILSGETSDAYDTEETISETTWKKSLDKRNEKTYTAPVTEKETEAKVTETTKAETETEATTVPETETDGESVTETGGSGEETESGSS